MMQIICAVIIVGLCFHPIDYKQYVMNYDDILDHQPKCHF